MIIDLSQANSPEEVEELINNNSAGSPTETSYNDFKEALGNELKRVADGFVRIGYMLRVAKDTDILKDSGYHTVEEFAFREYGLDKSQVSRFRAINEKFSKGGYSDCLEEQYEGYGVAKLGIMLQLPDSVNRVLSPEFTKAEINMVKDEVKAEERVSDIERALEPKEEGCFIENVLAAVLRQDPLEFKQIWEIISSNSSTDEKAAGISDIWAPTGEAIKTVRLANIGRIMLKVAKGEQSVKTIAIRTNKTETYSWMNVINTLWDMFTLEGYKESWAIISDEPFPDGKNEEVAPVQQKEEPKKSEKPKITKAEPDSKPVKTEEQKYNEKQAKIDRETKKKLEEIEEEEHIKELSKGAPRTEPVTHDIKLSANFWTDLVSGKKKFELRKNDRDYRVNDKLLMREHKNGEPTGRTILADITYMLEDYTGLTEGYAILGIELIEVTEGTDEDLEEHNA